MLDACAHCASAFAEVRNHREAEDVLMEARRLLHVVNDSDSYYQ